MSQQGRVFDREFKVKAVELSYQGENIKELAHELGIRPELFLPSVSLVEDAEVCQLGGPSLPTILSIPGRPK